MSIWPNLFGVAGFGLLLVQGVREIHVRRQVENIQKKIDAWENDSRIDAANFKESAIEILNEVKAQLARYRPWQGWLYVIGVSLIIISYFWRILSSEGA